MRFRMPMQVINLVISATQTSSYNIFTTAFPSGQMRPALVIVTINAGVVLMRGMTTGSGWLSGSSVKIINHGRIAGVAGGVAVGNNGFGWGASAKNTRWSNGEDGFPGGTALLLNINVTIDNTDGEIFGGGGQGGGGGAASDSDPPLPDNPSGPCFAAGGGGGGAGQGYVDAFGNNPPFGGYPGDQSMGLTSVAPQQGGSGSTSGPGAGGTRGFGGTFGTPQGGDGGAGGGWGQAGSAGNATGYGTYKKNPGGGGAAGKAINLNGFTVSWLGGNDSTHVKGAVS